MIKQLHDLRRGQCGVVAEIRGPDTSVQRLYEIGVRRGADLRMVRPGRPCIFAIEDHPVSFRDSRVELLVEIDSQQ